MVPEDERWKIEENLRVIFLIYKIIVLVHSTLDRITTDGKKRDQNYVFLK